MKFWCRYWHTVGLGVAAAAGVLLAVFWKDLNVLARIQTLNFITLILHQFEEYSFPGGMGLVMNTMQAERRPAASGAIRTDRYPLNQFSAMFGNCLVTYVVYTLPIFFPNVIWFGMIPILFGMVFQVVMHVIVGNLKSGSFYNPGMLATLLGHVPLGICFFYYTAHHGLLTAGSVAGGIIGLFLFIATFMIIMFKILPDKNSSWPFSPEENARSKKVAERFFHKLQL